MCVQPLPVTNRIYGCWTDNLMKPYPLGISRGMAEQEGRGWGGRGGDHQPKKPVWQWGRKKEQHLQAGFWLIAYVGLHLHLDLFFVNPHWILVAAAAWSQNDPWNNLRIIFAPARVDYTLEVGPRTMSVRLGKQFADNWNNLSLSFQSASLANMSTIHDLEDPKNFVPIPQTVFCLSII